MKFSGGYAQIIRELQQKLAPARREAVKKLINCGMVPFAMPHAGMFVLAGMKDGPPPSEIAALAAKQRIILGPGHIFRPHHEAAPWMRFNVAFCNDPRLYRFLRSIKRVPTKPEDTAS